jgi:hypothetical protein
MMLSIILQLSDSAGIYTAQQHVCKIQILNQHLANFPVCACACCEVWFPIVLSVVLGALPIGALEEDRG